MDFNLDNLYDIEELDKKNISNTCIKDWNQDECVEIETLNAKVDTGKIISVLTNNLSIYESVLVHKYYTENNIKTNSINLSLITILKLFQNNEIEFTEITLNNCFNNIMINIKNIEKNKHIKLRNNNFEYYINSWIIFIRSFILNNTKRNLLIENNILNISCDLTLLYQNMQNDKFGMELVSIKHILNTIVYNFVIINYKLYYFNPNSKDIIKANIPVYQLVDYNVILVLTLLYYSGIRSVDVKEFIFKNNDLNNFILNNIIYFDKYLIEKNLNLDFLNENLYYYNIFYIILKTVKDNYHKPEIIKLVLLELKNYFF